MRCFRCKEENDHVISTRSAKDGNEVRRRRECLNCGARVTTYEQISKETGPSIIDETGKRIRPSKIKDRLRQYINDACVNLPVSQFARDRVADRVALLVTEYPEEVVPTDEVFRWVAGVLGEFSEVARIRFELSTRVDDVAECLVVVAEGMAREYARSAKVSPENRTEIDADISV